ncbi:MAG: TetR/AcrR family transcriptional regulator [Galactobacillus timonensis]|uniref:TetR/AcrR family transcriptional regulator n=1 Tax=Galactobacillus timonensis TaxID=2041840 RepID=UPI00240A0B7D|nr:TetR/AcrR family transcriptional regulator [Galactobacillus timonensis]MDD5851923.1 TetR/AcrR family transcriptional regulator [Galactobacillus timonensis]MDD6599073.1 TetR/AcrR family transcriptional regulator [Galactobacillus timonensis]MDD6680529.1 TetR/AcrR family transcriptional regulator [Galactobacillus timonensis]MDY6282884.1 TetR/AcrR family transcriptional regulator [Erysipelotrichaceae bacterium]
MENPIRNAVIEAFVNLLKKKSYEEISVAEIIRKAHVGKTTFYRYFRDKADLMDAYFQMIYDQALTDAKVDSLEDLFAILLQSARDNPEQYAMFQTSGYNSFRSFIYRYTYKMGKEIVEAGWGRPLDEIEDLHIAYFCAGGSQIIEEWCRGTKYGDITSRQAAQEIMKMINASYRVRLNEEIRKRILQKEN